MNDLSPTHRLSWLGRPLNECSKADLIDALEDCHRNIKALREERNFWHEAYINLYWAAS